MWDWQLICMWTYSSFVCGKIFTHIHMWDIAHIFICGIQLICMWDLTHSHANHQTHIFPVRGGTFAYWILSAISGIFLCRFYVYKYIIIRFKCSFVQGGTIACWILQTVSFFSWESSQHFFAENPLSNLRYIYIFWFPCLQIYYYQISFASKYETER